MLFIKESGSCLRPTSPELWKLLGFRLKKRNTNVRNFQNVFFKKAIVHNLQKVSKGTVPNTMIYDKIHLKKATSRNLST